MIAILAAAALAAASPTAPKAVALAMIDAFNRHDAKALAALYAPDARVTSSDYCTAKTGGEVEAYYADFFRRFPDVHDAVDTVVADGEHVALRFTVSSQAGPAPLAFPIADFLTVKAGRIVSDDTLFDAGARCRK